MIGRWEPRQEYTLLGPIGCEAPWWSNQHQGFWSSDGECCSGRRDRGRQHRSAEVTASSSSLCYLQVRHVSLGPPEPQDDSHMPTCQCMPHFRGKSVREKSPCDPKERGRASGPRASCFCFQSTSKIPLCGNQVPQKEKRNYREEGRIKCNYLFNNIVSFKNIYIKHIFYSLPRK